MRGDAYDATSDAAANGSPSRLTRRALLRWGLLIGGSSALGSLMQACGGLPNGISTPSAVSSGAPTKLVLLDAENIDTPEAAPRKQVVTDFMVRNPDLAMHFVRCRAITRGGVIAFEVAAGVAFATVVLPTDQVVLFAGLAIAIIPPLLVFALLQPSFTDGLTVGAVRY